ncbi:hypothetical protein TcWFU_002093 [Taenia crassiceps]|uniref:Uncharacterized protein n=1 Tax=Taenia crassiceps TaxID=6207 RepID=A0ABR4QFS1_9CEST
MHTRRQNPVRTEEEGASLHDAAATLVQKAKSHYLPAHGARARIFWRLISMIILVENSPADRRTVVREEVPGARRASNRPEARRQPTARNGKITHASLSSADIRKVAKRTPAAETDPNHKQPAYC